LTEAIEYEQFDQTSQPNGSPSSEPDLSRLSDIPMELSVEIGRTHMTVGETLELTIGSVVTLEREAGQPVDLLVNGTAIARGEVVVVEEQYGLRVTEILDSRQEGERDGTDAEPAADGGAGEETAPLTDGAPDAPAAAQG
jgi:flagellar motor switch protein FliN/FliY